jgi:hypothetical protein
MCRRLISFGGSALAIEYSGARIARIVEFLYQYIVADTDLPPQMTYRVMPATDPSRMAVYRGDVLIYEGDSEATLADVLMGDTCHHLADQSRGGLLFHAAGLAWHGKGLILPGPVGAGKSTLAAWLLARGFDYLTDEMVFVAQDTGDIQALTRPLNLKRSARQALRDQFDFEEQSAHILSTSYGDLISPTMLKPLRTLSALALNLIIFPRYVPDSDFLLRPLSTAQAGLALMECLVNARNLPEYGFPQVVRLAQVAPAYKMDYARFDQIGGHIEALLHSARAKPDPDSPAQRPSA